VLPTGSVDGGSMSWSQQDRLGLYGTPSEETSPRRPGPIRVHGPVIGGAYHHRDVALSSRLIFISDERSDYPDAELEFRQLQYFLSVAEELHFGRAAARMFISQPALSQAIAGLERSLDAKLFARTRQNVELTAAGAELLRHARGLLADRADAVADVRRVDRGEAGVLRLGVALLAEHEVAPALVALAAKYPQLLLDRSSALSERVLGSLQNRDVDAALTYAVPVLGGLEDVDWEVIRRGKLAALTSSASALAKRDSAKLEDLRDETLLAPPRELAPSAFEGLQTMCRTYGGFDPKLVELSTSTLPLGTDWRPVVTGDAVAVMAEGTARAIRPEGAVAVPIEPPPEYVLAIAWRRGNESPVLQRFLAFIRAYGAEHDWAP
jgi:DNA-binding transcriptional LysR family regulator